MFTVDLKLKGITNFDHPKKLSIAAKQDKDNAENSGSVLQSDSRGIEGRIAIRSR